jgi:hypothetical protein
MSSDEIKQIIDLSLGTTYKRKTYYFSDLLAIFIEIKGFVAQRFHNYMILKVLIIFDLKLNLFKSDAYIFMQQSLAE